MAQCVKLIYVQYDNTQVNKSVELTHPIKEVDEHDYENKKLSKKAFFYCLNEFSGSLIFSIEIHRDQCSKFIGGFSFVRAAGAQPLKLYRFLSFYVNVPT